MQYKYTVLTNTTIGTFMAILDTNIVLISLPTIIRELPGTTTLDGIWIIMGYLLVTATILLSIGRLGDIFGRVKLYNLGFAVFTAGSALCSAAPDGTLLVVFRLVQGLGSALIWSNNAAIVTDAFPVNERGKALGINQVAGTAGAILGLVVGGILTGLLGWRSIFWINIGPGVFATVWAYVKLRDLNPPLRGERLDPLGNAFFAIGLTLFLLGLTFGAITGWGAGEIVTMAIGILTMVGFVVVEIRARNPMMDLRLFRIRAFSSGIAANLLAGIARGSVSLILVFYFQGVLLLDPLTAGVLLVPFSVAFVSAGPLSGYLSDRFGPRLFSTGGMLVCGAALFWFSLLPNGVPYRTLVLPMLLVGVGGGMFVAPNIAAIMNSVPLPRRGVASGISSTLVNVGSLLSLGITFAVLATIVPLATLQSIFAGLPVAAGAVDSDLFVAGMHEAFVIMAVISLAAALPSARTGTPAPPATERNMYAPSPSE